MREGLLEPVPALTLKACITHTLSNTHQQLLPSVPRTASSMQQFGSNKHVLITGGSEGLGLALAKQLVAQNARVSLVARTKSKLEAAAVAVAGSTDNTQSVSWHSADVTKYPEVGEWTYSLCMLW